MLLIFIYLLENEIMKPPQTLLDDLQFTHSMWLNELSHLEVTLSLFAQRLNLHGANLHAVPEPEAVALIQIEIEQLMLAITFIKKEIIIHVKRINKRSKLNGELDAILNGEHQENQERILQLRDQVDRVKAKFYNIVPVTV